MKNIPNRVPAPSHRHAAPSGPWPWMDLGTPILPDQLKSERPPVPPPCDHTDCEGECWVHYPASRFPNWMENQVRRAKIADAIKLYDRSKPSVLYVVDTDTHGLFHSRDEVTVTEEKKEDFWNVWLRSKREEGVRTRCLFVENMTGPVLQMLGARYNIEPFFFSSSINWIPARYQEEVRPRRGDHITISLTFLTTAPNPLKNHRTRRQGTGRSIDPTFYDSVTATPKTSRTSLDSAPFNEEEQVIDTQAPLAVRTIDGEHRILLLDLLAVHFIRDAESSTIISYHPNLEQTEEGLPPFFIDRHGTTRQARSYPPSQVNLPSAPPTLSRIGESVYWQNLFSKSPDPTFVLVTYLWHALYAWDEALETLYQYVCYLETQVINTSDMGMTRELHIIRAHHLHYSSLLKDFAKTVHFVSTTSNPAMDAESVTDEERENSKQWLKTECDNLMSQIERLQKGRKMQDQRLKNVMNLVFSSVNIADSRRMQSLTQAAVKDSAAMKQIAYLTMIFLPASFLATVFGMNVHEVTDGGRETVPHYVAGALVLTFATIWIIMAFQSDLSDDERATTVMHRLAWPYFWTKKTIKGMQKRRADSDATGRSDTYPMSYED
ncbi:hypothetical protein CCMSSC00406_0006173 [Pleurotus cornucopiae]|uniref:Uncharacterized protein n=1 Tax=Pleurotus cornucopiae TaxID=5321 RepID=A0ACB7J7Q2_PLECO|nr:hypothetical protein CCMSSC00406_0006173 [Pleurotus cornucopiae]